MPINTKNMIGAYAGSQAVVAIAMGSELVWSGGTSPVPLPTGYTRIADGVRSSSAPMGYWDNTQYIDTGYVATSSNYSYEVDIIPTTTGSFYSYMGFMASSTNPRAGLHEYSGTFMIGANATTNATGHSPVKNQRVRLKAVFKSGNQRLYKDGVLVVSNSTTFDHSANTLSTHIFARNYSSGRNQSKIKLFEALIYEGDYPVRRFIPIRRKSDNVLGLYETFTKTFCANGGTGTFTAGPTLTSNKALISSTHKIGGRNMIER